MRNKILDYIEVNRELDKLRHIESFMLGILTIVLALISIIFTIKGLELFENNLLNFTLYVVIITNSIAIVIIVHSPFMNNATKRVKNLEYTIGIISVIFFHIFLYYWYMPSLIMLRI